MARRFVVTGHRLRVVEAAAALAATRLALLVLPFAWIAKATGTVDSGRPHDKPLRATSDPVSLAVRGALRAAARRLPGRTTCLARAVAGRLMLAWRGRPSTLVIGVALDGHGLSAHAWLITSDGYVCGGRDAGKFHPLAAMR